MKLFVSVLCLTLYCAANAEQLTVRVDASVKSAPRLLINSKPVRSRMVFVIPGSGTVEASSEWRQVTFEFRCAADATNGTMHFRFGQQPGDVFIDNLSIRDIETGTDVLSNRDFEQGPESFAHDFTFWPPAPQNTVGMITVDTKVGLSDSAALHINLKAPGDGKWPDFHIYTLPRLHLAQDRRYRVAFSVRAEPARKLAVALYRPGAAYVPLGGPPGPFENQVRLAAGAGIDFVTFPIDMPWPAPGVAADWTAVDQTCRRVLDANSNALMLPRFGMDPPEWWRQAHPDLLMKRENGAAGEGAVVASQRYRKEAAAQLTELVRHLEDKFGNHMAGYHPCGQNTGEWFYHQAWGNLLNGYAPADLAAWREWLSQRYGTDEKLRNAWHQAGITIDAVTVPSPAERHASPNGVFRDPSQEQPLIDWAEFQQESMADCVCELARAIHQASGHRKLAVFFYGYVFEFGALPTGPSVAGHYALRRVLGCPDVDVLCSPISYFDRGLGQTAPSMTAAESVELAGKLWLNEDDTHTYLASEEFPGSTDHVKTIEETNAELLRNAAQESMRNFGTWWMDLGGSGWFNDARMWTLLTQLKALDDRLVTHPVPFKPEIAAVLDEQSMWRVSPNGSRVTRNGIYEARSAFGRMGAPWGQYLLDDVLAGRVDSKLLVFLNAWALSDSERAALTTVTRNRTAVWCYAPEYFDTNSFSLTTMTELTGFRFKKLESAQAWATPTDQGRRAGLTQPLGLRDIVSPLFAITDAAPDEILATYPDGSAAIAFRSSQTGNSLFVGVPALSSELLRIAAHKAGAHLFAESDCNVYANGPYVVLHASKDGPLQIDTGSSDMVTNVITLEPLGLGPKLLLPIKRGETRVLQIRP